jgi:hypothetical protein
VRSGHLGAGPASQSASIAASRPAANAINIAKGTISDRVELADVPGNLVFHDGLVISQSATHIAAYQVKRE